MLAAHSVGGHFLAGVAIVDSGVDTFTEAGSSNGVISIDVCGVRVADASFVGALVKAEDKIVAQFVIVKERVDRAGKNTATLVEAIIDPARTRDVKASQAIMLILVLAGETLERVGGVAQVGIGFPIVCGHFAFVVGHLRDDA